MCAIFGATAAYFIFKTIISIIHVPTIKSTTWLVSMGAYLFAFSPLVWEYSITAEVFALNNALCSIALFLFVDIVRCLLVEETSDQISSVGVTGKIVCGGFVSGLCMSNQHTSLLHISYIILVLTVMLFRSRRRTVIQTLVLLVVTGIAFIGGLSPYIYLYWASHRNPVGSWGDTTTISGWLKHILRTEYGTFQLGGIAGRESAIERIVIYIRHTSMESFHLLFPIIAIALFVFIGKRIVSKDVGITKPKKVSRETTMSQMPSKKKLNKISTTQPSVQSAIESKVNMQSSSPNIEISDTKEDERSVMSIQILLVFGLWIYYTLIWHCVFSNLPLSAPMPFGVHARFWMQPNLALYTLLGVSIHICNSYYHVPSIIDFSLLVVFLSLVLFNRFALMDKSSYGWVLHRYAENTLKSLPPNSLLLAHTDLDWNPMRYLRLCEMDADETSFNRNLDHLSIQMMPYPWFPKKQLQHFPRFKYPNLAFPGIATDRSSEGNAIVVTRILHANLLPADRYSGGVYLDMQSVNEAEIEDMGQWRGYTLIPYGSQYNVLVTATNITLVKSKIEASHVISWKQLKALSTGLPEINDRFMTKFPHGSWEAAVMNVITDSHYQLGLFYLTFAIDQQKSVTLESIPFILDRYLAAKELLTSTWEVVSRHKTLSSSDHDLLKNTALTYLRIQAILSIAGQYQNKLMNILKNARKIKVSFSIAKIINI